MIMGNLNIIQSWMLITCETVAKVDKTIIRLVTLDDTDVLMYTIN